MLRACGRLFRTRQLALHDRSMSTSIAQNQASAWKASPDFRVSEIFTSVQGEGPFVGRPSVFLRLGICNLSCVWCDTPYTWLFSDARLQKVRSRLQQSQTADRPPQLKLYDKQTELSRISSRGLLKHILQSAGPSIRNVVITGGEPLLHKKPLLDLVPALLEETFSVEFETNGTISPTGLPTSVHFNVSPKLSNSLQPYFTRINYEVLEQFLLFPSCVFKFVVASHQDLDEVCDIVRTLGIPPRHVFLMAQGTDSDTIRERGRWIVDLCQAYGFNYSHRVHVELWGDKRGV